MERLLTELYPLASWADIGAALPGITRTAVYARAKSLGLERTQQPRGGTGAILRGVASEGEIGWLAGFIDGEGTLQLSQIKRSGHESVYLAPTVRVVNNDLGAAEKCVLLMGGNVREHRPGTWVMVIRGMAQVTPLLTVLLPHLTVKRHRAELLIEYARVRRSATNRRAQYGTEEEALYRAFYEGSGRVSASRTPRFVNSYANAVLSEASDGR